MFSDVERQIFTYWDGSKEVKADPLRIECDLLSHPECDFSSDLKKMQLVHDEPKEAIKAMNRLLDAICFAFKVKQYQDGEGLMIPELLSLVGRWRQFSDEIKKKQEPLPIS